MRTHCQHVATYVLLFASTMIGASCAVDASDRGDDPGLKQEALNAVDNGRVVGGTPVPPGTFPAMVALLRPSGAQFCGGTLIGDDWVLTAKHCPTPANVLVDTLTLNSGGRRIGVAARFDHPSFDATLLQLSASAGIAPALIDRGTLAADGAAAVVSGWGATVEGGSGSNVLLQADVAIIDKATCNSDGWYDDRVSAEEICAGRAEGGFDTCQGDSGGPLWQYANGVPHLVGITSWGDGCARPRKPGIYVGVASVSAWIDAVMIDFELAGFGYVNGGWRVENHPRFVEDLNADGRADIIGFGDAGVYTALNNGDGSFAEARYVLADFGYSAGGWRVERHPRHVLDLNGDGRADILGFGDAGVYIALGLGDGGFAGPQYVLEGFGYGNGGWRIENHPRFVVDVSGDGRPDIVGFGDAGVYTALNNGDGTFASPGFVLAEYGYSAGGWRTEYHPRILADISGDGRADIVGFGNAGVYTSLSNGDGSFAGAQYVIATFGYNAGGWRVENHPRFVVDVSGDGRADIVGFGDAGVYTALSNGDGGFAEPVFGLANFGYSAGGWRTEYHPRLLADLNADGRADIVGFGNAGVYSSLSLGDGSFTGPQLDFANFGYVNGGWRIAAHPRFLAELNGDGRADIIGFGDAGIFVRRNRGSGF